MQRFSFLALLAGAVIGWQTTQAQLTSREQDRARDLLRKKLAEDQSTPSPASAKPVPTKPKPSSQPMPMTMPSPAMTPSEHMPAPATKPAMSRSHEQMLQILHRALAQQDSSSVKAEAPATHRGHREATEPAPPISQPERQPATAETPAGPKTKAQKIADLNELYFADQISPTEYHKRRAAILAEP